MKNGDVIKVYTAPCPVCGNPVLVEALYWDNLTAFFTRDKESYLEIDTPYPLEVHYFGCPKHFAKRVRILVEEHSL